MGLERFFPFLKRRQPLGYAVTAETRHIAIDATPLLGPGQTDHREHIFRELPATEAERTLLVAQIEKFGARTDVIVADVSPQRSNQFFKLQEQLDHAVNLSRGLIVDSNDYVTNADSISSQTYAEKLLAADLSLFRVLEITERVRVLTASVGIAEALAPLIDLSEVNWAGRIAVRTNGIALYDLENGRLAAISTPELARTFLQFLAFEPQGSGSKTRSVYGAYPNIEKFDLLLRNSAFRNLLYFAELEAFNIPFDYPPALKGVKERVFAGIRKVQDRLFEVLTDPANQFHGEVAALLSQSFSRGILSPYYAVQLLGILDEAKVREMYTLFKPQVAEGIQARQFVALAEFVGDVLGLGKLEDIEPLFGETDLPLETVGEADLFVQSAKHCVAIAESTPSREFDLDPQLVEFGNIARPTAVKVNLDRQNPQRIGCQFVWVNELGESTEVKLNVDSKRQRFAWSIFEDPSGVEAAPFRKAFLAAAAKAIESIAAQAAQQKRERLEQRSRESGVTPPSTRRAERNRDPIYALRGQIRQEAEEQRQRLRVQRLQELRVEEAKAAIKKEIVFPGEAEWAQMVRGLNEPDKELLRKEILDFNVDGTGRLDRKIARGRDGRPLYTRRVSCSVPKGARILMAETEAAGGVRRFEILSILYRKNVYRRNGI